MPDYQAVIDFGGNFSTEPWLQTDPPGDSITLGRGGSRGLEKGPYRVVLLGAFTNSSFDSWMATVGPSS